MPTNTAVTATTAQIPSTSEHQVSYVPPATSVATYTVTPHEPTPRR